MERAALRLSRGRTGEGLPLSLRAVTQDTRYKITHEQDDRKRTIMNRLTLDRVMKKS